MALYSVRLWFLSSPLPRLFRLFPLVFLDFFSRSLNCAFNNQQISIAALHTFHHIAVLVMGDGGGGGSDRVAVAVMTRELTLIKTRTRKKGNEI